MCLFYTVFGPVRPGSRCDEGSHREKPPPCMRLWVCLTRVTAMAASSVCAGSAQAGRRRNQDLHVAAPFQQSFIRYVRCSVKQRSKRRIGSRRLIMPASSQSVGASVSRNP